MLELLNQMDGFDSMGDVKVCLPIALKLRVRDVFILGELYATLHAQQDEHCPSLGMCDAAGYHGNKQDRLTGPGLDQTWQDRQEDRVSSP